MPKPNKHKGSFGATKPPAKTDVATMRHIHSVWSETIGKVLISLIKWGGLVFLAYYGFKTVEAASGKTTDLKMMIDFAANLGVNKWFAYAFGCGGIGYGVFQRKFRKDRVAELSTRIQGLESTIDSRRSSSKLKKDGTTSEDY